MFAAILFLLSPNCPAQSSDWELQFLSNWHDPSLPPAAPQYPTRKYSACWGLAVNGREYAVLGGARHVFFFDVTVPTSPVLVGKFAGDFNTTWREFKSYKNRVYAVSDGGNNVAFEGLMVFDLSRADTGIVRTYWSNEFFNKAHTITLDTTSGRIYLNGGSATQGVIVLDVSQNPDKPVLLAHAYLNGKVTHDSYVRHDTLYVSAGWDGYRIYDMKNPNNPVLLAEMNTGGYNHNSWLNKEGTYAYYTEEVPDGLPIRIIDLSLLQNNDLEIAGAFLHKFSKDTFYVGNNGSVVYTSAIPHNVYIRDTILFNSQYEDGLLAYDISNPTQPVLLARYDTYPQNVYYDQYHGNWGNYPWLPSGNIIASDMQTGLYMLRLVNTSTGAGKLPEALQTKVSPNPAADALLIEVGSGTSPWQWELTNFAGQPVAGGSSHGSAQALPTAHLPRGIYFLRTRDKEGRSGAAKVVLH